MKLFTILLCIAIGSVFGELERREFGEENFEVTEDEARFLIAFNDDKPPYSSDESLQVKYALDNSFDPIAANTNDADSVEKETLRNPWPVIETSTVKPSSSKEIKKNLEIMYLEKPAKHSKDLREIAHRDSTRSETLKEISGNFLKKLLMSMGARSRSRAEAKYRANNSRKILRRKREAEVKDPDDPVASLKVCAKLRKKFPVELRLKVLNTDEAEERLVEAFATSKHVPVDFISSYNSAKLLEREELRKEVAAAGSKAAELTKTYKTLRKGKPWNSMRLRGKFKKFFAKPSEALKQYEALKRDELTSIDGFLAGFGLYASRTAGKKNAMKKSIEEVKAVVSEKRKRRRAKEGGREPKKDEQFTTGLPKIEVPEVEDHQNVAESLEKYMKLTEVFQEPLRLQLQNTDEAEKVVLLSCVQSDYVSQNLLDNYYAERKREIELLKTELAAAGSKESELFAVYKSIRKGSVWNFLKSGSKERQAFFKKSSTGRSEYEALKKKELDIDRYLDGSVPIEDKAPERDDKEEAEGIQRASAIEVEKAKEKEEDTEKTETAASKGDDPANIESSLMVQNDIQSKLSEWLAGRITVTNNAEEKLLDSYAQATSASANLLADYNDAKAKEREVLKLEMAGGGPEKEELLANYKKLRKGSAWNSVKLQDKYKTFFETPSAALTEYESVKQDELSIDLFLNGENAVTAGSAMELGENGDLVTRYAYRKARAKFGKKARAKADWKDEEMERKVRAKETETIEVEKAAYRATREEVVARGYETKKTTDRYTNPDSVRLGGAKSTENTTTTADAKGNINSNLLKIAIFFAAVMQLINVILILGPQSDKFIDWCKRMKRTDAKEERESLYTEKSYWNGPKKSKVCAPARNAALM